MNCGSIFAQNQHYKTYNSNSHGILFSIVTLLIPGITIAIDGSRATAKSKMSAL